MPLWGWWPIALRCRRTRPVLDVQRCRGLRGAVSSSYLPRLSITPSIETSPGEPAQGVETHVAPYAQVDSVLLLNGRGVRVAPLQAQLAGTVVSGSATTHRRIVVTRAVCFGVVLLLLSKPPDNWAYFMRPHEGQAKVCPVAR